MAASNAIGGQGVHGPRATRAGCWTAASESSRLDRSRGPLRARSTASAIASFDLPRRRQASGRRRSRRAAGRHRIRVWPSPVRRSSAGGSSSRARRVRSTVRSVMRAAAALCMAWISTPGSSRARIWLACRPWVRKPAGQRGADDDGDDGVPGVRARVIRVDGAGHGLVQARHLLDAPVGLAGQVDDGDDRPLDPIGGPSASTGRGLPAPGPAIR